MCHVSIQPVFTAIQMLDVLEEVRMACSAKVSHVQSRVLEPALRGDTLQATV
jgi:hypothetical protein